LIENSSPILFVGNITDTPQKLSLGGAFVLLIWSKYEEKCMVRLFAATHDGNC
jgi:hypothetical protein